MLDAVIIFVQCVRQDLLTERLDWQNPYVDRINLTDAQAKSTSFGLWAF